MMPSMNTRSTGDGTMRNVSSSHEEKYQTWDGNVTVTNFKRGLWSVHPRGRAPFTVGSKREAFDQALGIAKRHWGLPKKVAFPPRSKRSHATKTKAGGRRAHATKTKVRDKTSDKINIDQLAKLFDLPDWDKIDEMNQQHYWEMSQGAEDEEAQLDAERAAQDEVYGQWYDAVESAANKLFEEHHLELSPTGKEGTAKHRYNFKIVPQKSWLDAAEKIRQTADGVGFAHVGNDVKEFLSLGPWTARQAVLGHLGAIASYPAVYGGSSAQRMYEAAW